MDIKLTVKNYKCFADEPVSVEFKNDFTAFTGPNNSGKSAMLKLVYEMGNYWNLLQTSDSIYSYDDKREIYYHGSQVGRGKDPGELFFHFNNSDMVLSIEIDADLPSVGFCLVRHDFSINRNDPQKGQRVIYYRRSTGPYRIADKSKFIGSINSLEVESHQSSSTSSSTFSTNLDTSLFFNAANTLEQSLYIPPFRNALNSSHSNYYGFDIGNQFIANFKRWSSDATKETREKIIEVTERIGEILGFSRFGISVSGNNESLNITVNKKSVKLEEMGSGVAQIILVFFNVAMKKPGLIFFDEPEASFHPKMQVDFLRSLQEFSQARIVFATHSLGLARILAPDSTYAFQMDGERSRVSLLDSTKDYIGFKNSMSYYAFRDFGFDKILLVEGPTDIAMVKVILSKLEKEHRFLVLSLGGSSTINGNSKIHLEELKTRLGSDIACLIDSEKGSKDEKLSNEREAFKKLCKKLEIKLHVTKKRALDNYLSDSAIKSALNNQAMTALSDFESLKKRTQPKWGKSENARIAREMTKDEFLNTDIGEFLNSL